jgi:hypothetical protein
MEPPGANDRDTKYPHAAHVAEVVDSAPRLTADQRAALTEIFGEARGDGGAAA